MSTTKLQLPVKINSREDKMGANERHRKETSSYVKSTACNPTTNNNVLKGGGGGRKSTRKRVYSFPPGSGKAFIPLYKRRCKGYEVRPPTKFLLGGNIYDPLNLNSLQDEAVNREMNAVTPKSSPLPTPRHRRGAIEVIIPPNVHDPLNLLTTFDDDAEYEQNLVSPVKRGRKKNRKKKRNSLSAGSAKENSEGSSPLPPGEGEEAPAAPVAMEVVAAEAVGVAEGPLETPAPRTPDGGACRNLDLPLKKETPKDKSRKCSVKDKIVSPVVPQPRLWTRPHGHRHHQKSPPSPQTPNFKAKNAKYQYGNYNRYYGYRNLNQEVDARLKAFSERRALFADKDVLDIGCNIGHVTLSVARDLNARTVVGLDIDQRLIDVARKNVRRYVSARRSPASGAATFYPLSMPVVYGLVEVPGVGESPLAGKKFPENVTFVQGSYVLDSDLLLSTERAQFDVVLCLSVTKWMHLNWGDAGLKQAFRRMYAQLRPGGRLILEAQGWDSYRKRKTLTEAIYKNYREIRFFPQKFPEYLLSEVGFSTCEILAIPCHPSKGFCRPIQMFTKGSFSSTYSAPGTPFDQTGTMGVRARAPVYTPVVVSTRSVDDDETFDSGGSRNSERVTEEDFGSSQLSEKVPEAEIASSHLSRVREDDSRDRGDMDSFRGVVCVTDGNEPGDESKASDFEESASVSSLVTHESD